MSRTFNAGRILIGLCFVLDAGWNLATWDLRALYLDQVGAPHFLTAVIAVLYGVFGLMVVANRNVNMAPLVLAATLFAGSLLLLTDVNGTGIGEYPAEYHVEVIMKEWVVHLAIIGALIFLREQSDPMGKSPLLNQTSLSRIGRTMVGAYFIVNALWQWYYFDIRLEHIQQVGRDGTYSLPAIIAIQLICGFLVAWGRWGVKTALVPLMTIITLSTVVVHGDISENAPYPANLQIHQWFVKASILAGLIMIMGHAIKADRTSKNEI